MHPHIEEVGAGIGAFEAKARPSARREHAQFEQSLKPREDPRR